MKNVVFSRGLTEKKKPLGSVFMAAGWWCVLWITSGHVNSTDPNSVQCNWNDVSSQMARNWDKGKNYADKKAWFFFINVSSSHWAMVKVEKKACIAYNSAVCACHVAIAASENGPETSAIGWSW